MSNYRVLIAGNPDGVEETLLKLTLLRVWESTQALRRDGNEAVLVHGTGSFDESAAKEWIKLGGTSEPHTAEWAGFGKQAPYVRNKEMVDSGADLCIVFLSADDRVAARCADLAEAAGIPTWRIEE